MHLLTEQALMAMGVPHPMMKEAPPANPAVARFYVDLIALLQEKTAGHRTDAESRQLEDLLYELRMRAMNLEAAADMPAGPKP
ncbi:hypothetical protein GETHPA_06440 [Geothrix rubra]|uniref:DUF1844 domain-containing protein n=2 Tax=Geothrix rubra TaxID=2927977 RepID=A0ABQ5Q3V5_9BACT|nr:hypothetical protein GETHPA_06440 [Geothrix rubra]